MRKKKLFTPEEKKSINLLSLALFFRMFSVFLVLPVFTYLAADLPNATPYSIALAFGAYALMQGLFQIPFGLLSDIFGRKKMLLIGLAIFTLGSLIVAVSNDIVTVTVGRFVQGIGAISSVIFAMIADVTRPEVRSAANAFLGMSIGLAFALAFILAPVLSAFAGLSELFLLITVLSVLALVIVWLFMPDTSTRSDLGQSLRLLKSAVGDTKVYEIYLGSFVIGMCMTFFMFNVQADYKYLNFPKDRLWQVYVPVLLVSAPAMFAAAFTAQKYYRFKEVITVGILTMVLALIIYLWSVSIGQSFLLLTTALFTFFIAFNMFEPIFPSLLTIKCDKKNRGTASGVFNFFTFIGNFLGALIAGSFYETDRAIPVYVIGGLLIIFFVINAIAKNPVKQITKNA